VIVQERLTKEIVLKSHKFIKELIYREIIRSHKRFSYMKHVYLLWHTYVDETLAGGEDVKLIGVYSSKELAEAALVRTSKFRGFSDQLEGFEISPYEVDIDSWKAGFTLV